MCNYHPVYSIDDILTMPLPLIGCEACPSFPPKIPYKKLRTWPLKHSAHTWQDMSRRHPISAYQEGPNDQPGRTTSPSEAASAN